MAPKLIFLITCLIDILYFKLLFYKMFLYVEQDVNLA